MTSVPGDEITAPSVAAGSVKSVKSPLKLALAMNPPELSIRLFGTDLEALAVEGTLVLNAQPFASFDSTKARDVLAQTDVLVAGWGSPVLSDEVLDRAPSLRHLLYAGGQGAVLLPATARERGIQVSNAGWLNAIPVAEFTLAMIVLANKHAFAAQRLYHERRAFIDREREFGEAGNLGKVVGVVGASRIGRIVLERLRSMDLTTLVYDPYLTEQDATSLGARLVALDELMATSDVVSLHPPLTPSTTGMITGPLLHSLRDGATLINTSRGAIVDQDAMIRELRTGRIQAVLDVTVPEVLPADSELHSLPNVFLTPHISGSMGSEIRRLGDHVAHELERLAHGLPLAFPEVL